MNLFPSSYWRALAIGAGLFVLPLTLGGLAVGADWWLWWTSPGSVDTLI